MSENKNVFFYYLYCIISYFSTVKKISQTMVGKNKIYYLCKTNLS